MFDPLNSLSEFRGLKNELAKERTAVSVSGSRSSQRITLAAALARDFERTLFVFSDEQRSREACAEAEALIDKSFLYPEKDILFRGLSAGEKAVSNQRTEVLKHLLEEKNCVIFASIGALMDPITSEKSFRDSKLILREGDFLDPFEWARTVSDLGYERAQSVEECGEFAVRGGICDIFPATEEMPVRIELSGDEIGSMRYFNCFTQRSVEPLSEIEIYPLSDSRKESEDASLTDYFSLGSLVVLDDPAKIKAHGEELEEELYESHKKRIENRIQEEEFRFFSTAEILRKALSGRALLLAGLDENLKEFPVSKDFRFRVEATGHFKDSFKRLVETLRSYQKKGFRVSLMTPSSARATRLAAELRDEGIRAFRPDLNRDSELKKGETEVVTGNLREGFSYPDIKYVLLTENDMFGHEALHRKRRKKYQGVRIGVLSELKKGDYVVHQNHGIGVYCGIEHVTRDGVSKDYIKIEYADGGKLYLPATRLELIQKYGSAEGSKPKLNRLSGSEWQRTRAKAKKETEEVAKELVALYAVRLNTPGYRYGHDSVWQKEFEEMFPYEETSDQLAAIESVKADMQSDRIMDRLICGDVGYGKTEIAMRAAFKAAEEGKQTALLTPTTILASQHFQTFSRRFEKFPVNVALLSRFRDPSENKKTLMALASGKIDIIIGTHRLLSDDVRFKDLGLLVIDEEQRFGVRHKEKIKSLKQNVEALSLSATPIPRTLHMSLSGIRDMSVLDEPPFDRVPVETYVLEFNDEYVREAIRRELRRSGQVFYVSNRVKGIEEKTKHLRELLPGAVIEYAHGQMSENELEEVMEEFVDGRIDVLVSSTIIESGLDIPNANTIIVDGAENMGLSQLYQLKGRVGRSGRAAYAFFMYRKDRMLKEEAEKRLRAIRDFAGFGSGIKIAMRDLEIRGAGNVLGTKQHGEIGAVGYELYVRLLSEAVRKERGLIKEEESFETSIDCDINAFIPEEYIDDEYIKLEMYKRIAELSGEEDKNELMKELEDRFSTPPAEVTNLIDIAMLKLKAHHAYVTELIVREGTVIMNMFPKAKIRVDSIPGIIEQEEGRLRFIGGKPPRFVYSERKGTKRDAKAMMAKANEIIDKLAINS